ncbi:MAG: hypothetical protein IIU36_03805 [Firmicutes bacterium]|nr:hypothetical protein [Bacillota bacterium]
MACFLVPTTEAIVTTVITKVAENKVPEPKAVSETESHTEETTEKKIPFMRKLRWLTNLLWGGSILLMFEHIWHGEVVPWFPFLTNAVDPSDRAEMLREMGTVGVGMAVLITLVWVGMLVVSSAYEKRAFKEVAEATE